MPKQEVVEVAVRLADAGIAVTVLPATDMFLLGRDRDHLVPRGIAPALLLATHGVTVTAATNNVLNPFTPYGDASLGRIANLFANAAQLSRDEDIATAFDMVTTNAARLMRRDYALKRERRPTSSYSTPPIRFPPSAKSAFRSPDGRAADKRSAAQGHSCFVQRTEE